MKYKVSFITVMLMWSITAFSQTWTETLNLSNPEETANDLFGYDVDIFGDFAVVGVPQSDVNTLAVDSQSNSGLVYVLKKDFAGNWNQVQILEASDREPEDYFGQSVAIEENYIVVGAHKEDESALNTDSLTNAGSVYVFEKDSVGFWVQRQKLTAADRGANDAFGWSVSMSQDQILIGAYADAQDEAGGNTQSLAGSAYVFELDQTGIWIQEAKIVASDRTALDYFGFSTAIHDKWAVVGAFRESHDVAGLNTMTLSGAIYLFERQGAGVWVQSQKLVAPDREVDDRFGISVSIKDELLVVGAFYEDEDPTGSFPMSNAGSAYIYALDDMGQWQFYQKIVSNDRGSLDFFGTNVSILSENQISVASSFEDEDQTGMNSISGAGSVYMFDKDDLGIWKQSHKIAASDRSLGATFGNAIAGDGQTLICGSSMKSVDGNLKSGGIYVFGLLGSPNLINGNIYAESNGNCQFDSLEHPMGRVIVKTEPNLFYGISNEEGDYSIQVDSGTFNVVQIAPYHPLFLQQLCPDTPAFHVVQFDSLGQTSEENDFGNEISDCAYLSVDVASNRRRRCFENFTIINYCNEGYKSVAGAKVYLELPEYVHLVSADESFTIVENGVYEFNIGTLEPGVCGKITVIDSVECTSGITGLTQCTKAWITPENDCVRTLDTINSAWNKSSMKVSGECEDDTVRLYIVNSGSGDMLIPQEYRIYSDGILAYTNTFQLNSGDSIIILIPANGTTIRLEADQHLEHPGNSHPRVFIEGCGLNSGGEFSLHQIIPVPQDDEDPEVEIHCLEIRDSYDPNDKQVSPEGITLDQLADGDNLLEYMIRFQNTGSDTAYRVVVVDTLPLNLDVASIQSLRGSHLFDLDVTGEGRPILIFSFENINLPDSLTDELNSSGYIRFKIRPEQNLGVGTILSNEAAIYFDFNEPIITNQALVVISHPAIEDGSVLDTIIEMKNESQIGLNQLLEEKWKVQIQPNPFTINTYITVEGSDNLSANRINAAPQIDIFSLDGRLVKTIKEYEQIGSKLGFNILRDDLESGMYLIKIRRGPSILAIEKLTIRD